jgi:hypothetical protein
MPRLGSIPRCAPAGPRGAVASVLRPSLATAALLAMIAASAEARAEEPRYISARAYLQVMRAELHAAAGAEAEAAAAFRLAFVYDQEAAWLALRAARAAWLAGETPSERPGGLLARARRLDADSVDVLRLTAAIRWGSGELDGAAGLLRRGLRRPGPEALAARLELATLEQVLGRDSSARRLLSASRAPEAGLALAWLEQRSGRPGVAGARVAELLRAAPGDPELADELRLLAPEGDRALARLAAAEARPSVRRRGEDWLELYRAALATGRERSLRLALQALRRRSDVDRREVARAALEGGDPAEALRQLAGLEDPEAARLRAYALHRRGRLDAALAALPDEPADRETAAVWLARAGRLAEARARLEGLEAERGARALGRVELAAGAPSRALEAWARLDGAEDRALRAAVLLRAGDAEAALATLSACTARLRPAPRLANTAVTPRPRADPAPAPLCGAEALALLEEARAVLGHPPGAVGREVARACAHRARSPRERLLAWRRVTLESPDDADAWREVEAAAEALDRRRVAALAGLERARLATPPRSERPAEGPVAAGRARELRRVFARRTR